MSGSKLEGYAKEWLELDDEIKALIDRKKFIGFMVMKFMRDEGLKVWRGIRYAHQTKKQFNSSKFREAHGDLWEAFKEEIVVEFVQRVKRD